VDLGWGSTPHPIGEKTALPDPLLDFREGKNLEPFVHVQNIKILHSRFAKIIY